MADTIDDTEVDAAPKLKMRKKATFALAVGLIIVGALIGFGGSSILSGLNRPDVEPDPLSVTMNAGRFLMLINDGEKNISISMEAEVEIKAGEAAKTLSQVRDLLINSAIAASEVPLLKENVDSDAIISEALNLIAKNEASWIGDIRLKRISQK